jgi:hypothetical protein
MNPGRLAVVVSGMTMASIERCDTTSPSSTGQLPRDVRVKFESLPVPLRVAARDRSDSGLLIEGDLPWLAVGTGLQVELPDGLQQSGRVQSFDIEVTPPGSARLRIFADLLPPPDPSAEIASPQRPARSWLLPMFFLVGAALGGYAGRTTPPLQSLHRLPGLITGTVRHLLDSSRALRLARPEPGRAPAAIGLVTGRPR